MIADNNKIFGFEPIIKSNTNTLILGTLPGGDSLKQGKYYANEDNLFWDIVYRILNPEWGMDNLVQDEVDYSERCKFLLSYRIGIWDVLASAERKGSSDSKIKNECLNDFLIFFDKHKSIKNLLFNGPKSYKYFRREFRALLDEKTVNILYSTSPSSSINSFFILSQWKKAIIDPNKRISVL